MAYANRGIARLMQGYPAEAHADFNQAVRLNKNLEPLIERRARDVEAITRLKR
jgi:hypothetical protein